jgi:hypothetical protein
MQDVPQLGLFMHPRDGREFCWLVLLRRTLFSYKRYAVAGGKRPVKPSFLIACVVLIALRPGVASAEYQAWGPWSLSNSPEVIGTQFLHDDRGSLTVICNRSTQMVSYILTEPRANWQPKSIIEVKTRADDGSETGPSRGHVLKTDALAVLEESKWDIATMGKGTTWFAMGAGGYARIFPAAKFRSNMDPVLRACGDHW